MKVSIKCQHCGKKSKVEDMGSFRCPKCGNFFVNMSEYVRQQINGSVCHKQGEKNG